MNQYAKKQNNSDSNKTYRNKKIIFDYIHVLVGILKMTLIFIRPEIPR
jgi:hypothetical protein